MHLRKKEKRKKIKILLGVCCILLTFIFFYTPRKKNTYFVLKKNLERLEKKKETLHFFNMSNVCSLSIFYRFIVPFVTVLCVCFGILVLMVPSIGMHPDTETGNGNVDEVVGPKGDPGPVGPQGRIGPQGDEGVCSIVGGEETGAILLTKVF